MSGSEHHDKSSRSASPSTVQPSHTPSILNKDTTNEKSSEKEQAHVHPLDSMASWRKLVLLACFALSQFIESSNICALFTSIPDIAVQLNFNQAESVWLLSAYQLTFASFLLLSGRVSDVYNPKHLFNGGFGLLGIVCLVAGFLRNKIALIVFRALMGICAAFTIPSALWMIVHMYPNPVHQERAIAVFGGAIAFGIVCGLVIGALFTQLASWIWVFYFNAIISIPIAILCVFLIPTEAAGSKDHAPFTPKDVEEVIEEDIKKVKKGTTKSATDLDLIGVSILTIALILFIYAVTTGSISNWSSGGVLAPLIISIFVAACFFYYETRIPGDKAALPPRMWFYPNFSVLFAVSLYPYLWWTTTFFLFSEYWQSAFHYTPLLSAARSLPLGFAAGVTIFVLIPFMLKHFQLRTIILFGCFILIPSNILMAFADRRDRYWSYNFPAFILGTSGSAILFVNANVAMLKYTPPQEAGVVGAIFNSALQIGAALGTSAITSIQNNTNKKQADPLTTFKGTATGFWFCLASIGLVIIAVVIFFKPDPDMGEPASKEKQGMGNMQEVSATAVST